MLAYWRFYWPLALIGVGMVLSVQFQNATLAKYPDAVTELAVLALAYGVFSFFNASLQFIAQLSNVYARSPHATRQSWRFVVLASALIMMPLAVIAGTHSGMALISSIFSIDDNLTGRVGEYLILLCPLILLNGQRHFFSGLLVQAKLTGWMTAINFIYLAVVIATLLTGLALAMKPAYVVVGAETLGVIVMLCLLLWARYRLYQPPQQREHETVTFRELWGFFIPVSTTGVMFALSRPILFAFVARTPDGIATIAALRVAFDFSMIFQQAANQFRHFFISFGFDDLPSKRRFMVFVGAGITAMMLVFSLTPHAQLAVGLAHGTTAPAVIVVSRRHPDYVFDAVDHYLPQLLSLAADDGAPNIRHGLWRHRAGDWYLRLRPNTFLARLARSCCRHLYSDLGLCYRGDNRQNVEPTGRFAELAATASDS